MPYLLQSDPLRPWPFSATEALSEGWRLLQTYFAPLFFGHVIFLILMLGANSLCCLVSLVLTGPIWVGFCNMGLKAVRGKQPEISDLFSTFQDHFVPTMIMGILFQVFAMIGFIAFPFIGMFLAFGSMVSMTELISKSPEMFEAWFFIGVLVVAFMSLLPIVLVVLWYSPSAFHFLDGVTDAWPAMEISRKTYAANRASWGRFWLLMSVLHIPVVLTCGLALLIVMPLTITSLAAAYEMQRLGPHQFRTNRDSPPPVLPPDQVSSLE